MVKLPAHLVSSPLRGGRLRGGVGHSRFRFERRTPSPNLLPSGEGSLLFSLDPPLAFEGRGTMRSMVEGRRASAMLRLVEERSLRSHPSTALRAVPLPCKGRGGFARAGAV